MKKISSRDFQKSYGKLDESFLVTSWDEPIGLWIPVDDPLYKTLAVAEEPKAEKMQPLPVTRVLPNGQPIVRTTVRVIDSVQIAKAQEISRENWRQQEPRRR